MSEILSIVRLKERILIIVVTLALALFVGAAAGAITYATTDRHDHGYDYTMKREADGGFVLEGFCDYEKCPEPTFRGIIRDSDVTSKVTVQPTCCTEGVRTYYFTWREKPEAEPKTYSCTEPVAIVPHSYKGNVILNEETGSYSIGAYCSNAGCSDPALTITDSTDVELVEVIEATCNSKRVEKYTVLYNGNSIEVVKEVNGYKEHTLNGVTVDNFLLKEGVYLYGTPGMTPIYEAPIGCNGETNATYICEVCTGKYTVKIGKPDHVLAYDPTSDILPTFEEDGRSTIRCTNEGCDYCIYHTLPMVVEGVNAFEDESLRNHIEEKRYVNYSYTDATYGIEISLVFDLDWFDHIIVYDESLTILPTIDSDGAAYVVCTYEGCHKSGEIIIPKIDITDGGNAKVVSPATEQAAAVYKYYYKNEEYNFEISFEVTVGEKLEHNYTYALLGTDKPLEHMLYGECNQPGCLEPSKWFEDVPVTMIDVEATCTNRAYFEYSCVYEGITYVYRTPEFGNYAHDFILLDKLKYPTADQSGTAVLMCNKADCVVTKEITLPKVVVDASASNYSYDPDTNTEYVNYSYTFKEADQSFTVKFTFQREKPHNHQYTYTLLPSLTEIGGLDLVGICTYLGDYCLHEHREVGVDAFIIEETGTCTEPGYAIWGYEKDGQLYTYKVEGDVVAGHKFTDFIITSDPTFQTPGSIDLSCSICGEFGTTLDLPVMYIGETCTIVRENSNQVVYSYAVSIEYEGRVIEIQKHIMMANVHVLAFAESETIYPTTTETGKAIFRCIDGGCSVFTEYELPKIVVDVTADNYSYDPETNIETVYYTHGFMHDGAPYVVEYTFTRVKPHNHEYDYRLEISATTEGGYDLVGHCTHTSCTEEVREENVTVRAIEDSRTCTEPGYIVWEHVKGGVSYTITQEDVEALGHDGTVYNISDIVEPTFDTAGSIEILCSVCGESVGHFELPAMVEGEEGNCEKITEGVYEYIVTIVVDDKEIVIESLIII